MLIRKSLTILNKTCLQGSQGLLGFNRQVLKLTALQSVIFILATVKD